MNALVTPADAPPAPTTTGRPRIETLDVLRGFALCGILLANLGTITHLAGSVSAAGAQMTTPDAWLSILVSGRFFPIFAFLFGVGFALFFESASQRTARPRIVLLRRMVAILVLGLAHQQFQPGEALLVYGLVGILVLLPATWLPRVVTLVAGVVLLTLSVTLAHGGLLSVPGLFLLGNAAVGYGAVGPILNRTSVLASACAVFAIGAVPALVWQLSDLQNGPFNGSTAVAGVLLAGVYLTGIALLMNTRARVILGAAFTPLGRLALSNYVGATALAWPVGQLLDLSHRPMDWTLIFSLAVGIIAVQWLFSALWLRSFRYGPLEWVLRCVTWWQLVPNKL